MTFQTYPSLKALYAGYMARVMALSGGRFHTNYGNCTEVLTSGERSWNHNVTHPIGYAFSLFPAGRITDDQAAGRLFCTFSNDQLHLVWTQDDGRLLARYSMTVKKADITRNLSLSAALDQSFHLIALFLTALLASK